MDGLLIESSPFWIKAELQVLNELGVPLTAEMTKETPSGLREDEIVKYWYERYPWHDVSIEDATSKIERQVADYVRVSGEAMAGVSDVIKLCKSEYLPLAIASSSSLLTINAVMDKLNITNDISVVCSAYDETHGKPNPAVYLTALRELNLRFNNDLHADECLVFEDSLNGVKAAKAAGMKCIAIPKKSLQNDEQFNIADITLHSLKDFNLDTLKKL